MNRNDDNMPDDATLTAYLEGKDGVSAAYRVGSNEDPPAALDAAILQAARASVQNKPAPVPATRLRHYYPLAASLMLGMLLGTYLLRNPPETAEFSTASQRVAVPADDAPVAIDTAAPLQEKVAAEAFAPVPAEPPASPTVSAEPPAPAPLTDARETTPDVQAPPPATLAADAGQLQEIQVTGSRITRANYRDNQRTWLATIASIMQQLENNPAEIEVPLLRQALEEERNLFQQNYPAVDLDAALIDLRDR